MLDLAGQGTFLSQSSLGPGLSYDLYRSSSPNWEGEFTRYIVYQTPKWFPIVHKQLEVGPLDGPPIANLRFAAMVSDNAKKHGLKVK